MPNLWVGSGFACSSLFSERLICDCVALGKVFMAFFSPMVLLSELDINLDIYFFTHIFIYIGNFFVYLFFLLLFSPLNKTCMHTEATALALAQIHASDHPVPLQPSYQLSPLSESVLFCFFVLV